MSPRDLDLIADDLRRWLAQAAVEGRQRFDIDPQIVAAARAVARRSRRDNVSDATPVAATAGAALGPVGDLFAPPPALVSPDASLQGEPAAQTRVRKAKLLAQLDADEVRGCTKCKLHPSRTNTVFGVGNPDATLVFVGEAPGRDEDLQGEPFVGMAGQLLNKILAAIGFQREDVYICNVLKCRPPNNRDPEADEVNACEPYLLRQLEILQPKVICALGRHAAYSLLGTTSSLAKLREHVHDYHGIPCVVTYHPAALLRNPQWKRPTWEDVQRLRALHDRLVAGA